MSVRRIGLREEFLQVVHPVRIRVALRIPVRVAAEIFDLVPVAHPVAVGIEEETRAELGRAAVLPVGQRCRGRDEVRRVEHPKDHHNICERRHSAHVRRNTETCRVEELLAFSISRQVGIPASKQLNVEVRQRQAVQDAADVKCGAGAVHHVGDHGEVLAIVGPDIFIVDVVRRHAVGPKVNAHPAVALEGVPHDDVPSVGINGHALLAVECDRVPGPNFHPAHEVVGRAGTQPDSTNSIRHGIRRHDTRPDMIALDPDFLRAGVIDGDAVAAVAGDHVAPPRARPADPVGYRRAGDVHAAARIGHRARA